MGKIEYFANHDNIHGNELIEIEQWVDLQNFIKYAVILKTKDFKQTLSLKTNLREAMDFADSYKTI